MVAKVEAIEVHKINVNILNPRYEPQESEIEEMNLIIKNGKLLELMTDIASYGLDPSENLIVSYNKEQDSYVCEEGNRRITAIKILNNPEITPEFVDNRDTFINKVKELKSKYNFNYIDKVNCVDISNKEIMKHFIELKHTGENDGAGRMSWDTESQYRYNSDPFKSYLIQYLKNMFPDNKGSFNLSTIDQRIISDPDMRQSMEMSIERNPPTIKFASKKGYDRFYFIVEGLIQQKFSVKHFYYKEDRIQFIKKFFDNSSVLSDDSITPDTIIDDSITSDTNIDEKQNNLINNDNDKSEIITNKDNGNQLELPKKNNPDNNQNNVQNTNKRNKYIRRQIQPSKRDYPFKGIIYNGPHLGISNALFELQNINIDKFPLATTILIRTLLECTIQEYILKKRINIKIKQNIPIKLYSIDGLLKVCTNNGNGNYKELEKSNKIVARIILEAHQKKDADELNLVAHGNFREPSIIAIWEIERRWYSAIDIMIQEISGQNI